MPTAEIYIVSPQSIMLFIILGVKGSGRRTAGAILQRYYLFDHITVADAVLYEYTRMYGPYDGPTDCPTRITTLQQLRLIREDQYKDYWIDKTITNINHRLAQNSNIVLTGVDPKALDLSKFNVAPTELVVIRIRREYMDNSEVIRAQIPIDYDILNKEGKVTKMMDAFHYIMQRMSFVQAMTAERLFDPNNAHTMWVYNKRNIIEDGPNR